MNEFLRSVAMLSLLRMAAEMLLPEGAMRKLCDVLLGMMIMLCMLTALQKLFSGYRS